MLRWRRLYLIFMTLINTQHNTRGFALLLSILAISAVLAISLTIMSLTIKQSRLASDSRDSEVAFHAANAGLECVRNWRRTDASDFESGESVDITCFGSSGVSPLQTEAVSPSSGDGDIYYYEYRITWGSGAAQRCSEMKFLIFNTEIGGNDLVLDDVSSYIDGYPGRADGDRKVCESGGLCTTFSSRGYSAACPSGSATFPIGTIQRDVYVEF